MSPLADPVLPSARRKPWWRAIYVQVLAAIALGTLPGWAAPSVGV